MLLSSRSTPSMTASRKVFALLLATFTPREGDGSGSCSPSSGDEGSGGGQGDGGGGVQALVISDSSRARPSRTSGVTRMMIAVNIIATARVASGELAI
eukprot:6899053-Prymnesium_polylepis.2